MPRLVAGRVCLPTRTASDRPGTAANAAEALPGTGLQGAMTGRDDTAFAFHFP